MPTIPTGTMERELRKLYLRWLAGLRFDSNNVHDKIDTFESQSQYLIEVLGGRTAALGALADFPAPKKLDLSPHIGTIYQDMHQAAIQAGIIAGLNSTDVARQMFNAGMGKSFNRLNRLARTETVSAYWRNAWDSINDLPALVMVWGAEESKRTCQWCRDRDGMVLDGPDIRDHPNGRCTPIPMLRSQVEYRGSVRSDGEIYTDPAWVRQPKPVQPTSGLSLHVPSQQPKAPVTMSAEKRDAWYHNIWESQAYAEADATGPLADAFQALARYQDRDHKIVNKALRSSVASPTAESMAQGIDQVFTEKAVPTPADLLAYRGGAAPLLKGAKVGDIVTDPAYVSTSLSEAQAKAFGKVVRIELPQGTPVLPGHLTEQELLLAKGTRFVVISLDPPTLAVVR